MTGYKMTPAYQPDKAAPEDMTAQMSADTLPIEHELHFQQAAAHVCSMCAYLMFVRRESCIKCRDGGSVKFEVFHLSFVILRQSH